METECVSEYLVLVLTWHKWCISDHQTSSKMTNSIFMYYVHIMEASLRTHR